MSEAKGVPCIGDEGVLSVVAGIILDKRFNEIMQENARLKERLALIDEVLKDTVGFADHLVWYARFRGDQATDQPRRRVEAEYSAEVKELVRDETNFVHGRNSGYLALSRLVRGLISADEEVVNINSSQSC